MDSRPTDTSRSAAAMINSGMHSSSLASGTVSGMHATGGHTGDSSSGAFFGPGQRRHTTGPSSSPSPISSAGLAIVPPMDSGPVDHGSIDSGMISGSGPIMARQSYGGVRPRVRTSDELIGQVLDSYRLVELIGSGGMGEVYRAEHIRLGRQVALKLLRAEYALRQESVARFFQEAQSVNRIRHRNIVDITDLDTLEDGTPFIIMELLEGVSLRSWIRDHHGETDRIMDIFVQICDGLAAAHEEDIIHRDLKPDNVMVILDHTGNDLAKLLDFGIAKLINNEDEDYGWKTTEGFVMGTPAYMAPEQAGGLPIDARTDIYALGAIMYEMLTGEPVFTGKSAGEFVRKHLNEDPIPPHQIEGGADLDPRIASVIMRCLAKEPTDRYASAIALRRDLQRILAGEEIAEVSTTRPLRATGRSSAAVALSGTHSQPVAHVAMTERSSLDHSIDMSVANLPAPATGRRILWSILPLLLAAGAAVAWFYLRPLDSAQSRTDDRLAITAPTTDDVSPPPVDSPPRENEGTDEAGDPEPVAPTQDDPTPTVARIVPVVKEVEFATVRFESKPIAKVYEWGSAKAQCTTPCDVAIPIDGEESHRFILSRDGYELETVTIDMKKPRKKIRAKLRAKRKSSRGARQRRNASSRPDGVVSESEKAGGTGKNGDPAGSGKDDPPDGDPPDGDPPDGDPPDGDPPDTTTPETPSDKVKPSDTLNPFGDQ